MAHFAELDDNNVVLRVIVVDNENEADGESFCHNLLGGRWKQTSYNTVAGVHVKGGIPFRKNYAGIGYIYDESRDAFLPPTPYPSWIVDESTGTWVAPVPMPTPEHNIRYIWNEQFVRWDEVPVGN